MSFAWNSLSQKENPSSQIPVEKESPNLTTHLAFQITPIFSEAFFRTKSANRFQQKPPLQNRAHFDLIFWQHHTVSGLEFIEWRGT